VRRNLWRSLQWSATGSPFPFYPQRPFSCLVFGASTTFSSSNRMGLSTCGVFFGYCQANGECRWNKAPHTYNTPEGRCTGLCKERRGADVDVRKRQREENDARVALGTGTALQFVSCVCTVPGRRKAIARQERPKSIPHRQEQTNTRADVESEREQTRKSPDL
jgi:hypothetical protein